MVNEPRPVPTEFRRQLVQEREARRRNSAPTERFPAPINIEAPALVEALRKYVGGEDDDDGDAPPRGARHPDSQSDAPLLDRAAAGQGEGG